jgi:hypothetical protein
MIINIVDEELRKEVRRVFTEEITRTMRSEVDTLLPELIVKRLDNNYKTIVDDRVGKTLADHMEIATTIFLQKELQKQESFMRQRFDECMEKVLLGINFDNYFKTLLGRNIDAIVDERIKQQLKKSFTVEIKENK